MSQRWDEWRVTDRPFEFGSSGCSARHSCGGNVGGCGCDGGRQCDGDDGDDDDDDDDDDNDDDDDDDDDDDA